MYSKSQSLTSFLLISLFMGLAAEAFGSPPMQGAPGFSETNDEQRAMREEKKEREAAEEEEEEEGRRRATENFSAQHRERFRANAEGLPIYGTQLFQGKFGDLSFSGFNPEYQLGIGDKVQVMLWGAMEEALELTVDARGNIFIPKVGPVSVLGVRNADLNELISGRVREVYSENIDVYANLRSTQTVKIFVSGHVERPGLYQGFSSDSVLYFLDRAGGIDANRGSFLMVELMRNGEVSETINLYDFLQEGELGLSQFRDGDVILVGPRRNTVTVRGAVGNAAQFEFVGDTVSLKQILDYAQPHPDATGVNVRRASGGDASSFALRIEEAASLRLQAGDAVEVTRRNVPRDLLIRFTGEHDGPTHQVLPAGAKLSDAIDRINATELSDLESIQLFRQSVARRQRELLMQSLDNLERNVLSASSATLEEARLRQAEADTTLRFIERAREVEPRGLVLLESLDDAETIYLEDGDEVHIPKRSNLVTVHGEVKYPNTQNHRSGQSLSRYIERAGGFAENANDSDLIVFRTNGLIDTVGGGRRTKIHPGDEIIVLPEPDEKRLLFAKEISTIIYQIALGARVVIGL